MEGNGNIQITCIWAELCCSEVGVNRQTTLRLHYPSFCQRLNTKLKKRKSGNVKVAGCVLHGYIRMLYIPFTNTNFQVLMTYRFQNLTYLVILKRLLSVSEIADFFIPKCQNF